VVTVEDNVLSAAEREGGRGGLLGDLVAFPAGGEGNVSGGVEVGM
jgi:hypothetical protein